MDIQELQDAANDVALARLELISLEEQKEAFLKAIPQLVELDTKIEETNNRKRQASDKMLELMRQVELKSWKTEHSLFARTLRRTAEFDQIVKKQIEDRLKSGEVIENWSLKETEFISIKTVK